MPGGTSGDMHRGIGGDRLRGTGGNNPRALVGICLGA
jgi:hypothetical protein